MIDPVGFLESLARYLDASGVARYVPAGAYTPGELAAVTFALLPTKPDTAVALTVYDESFQRDDHNPDVYVQFRWRAAGTDPRVVDRAADSATRLLHDASRFQLPGGPRVLLCRRRIRGLTTPDSNGRYERPDSYLFTLNPAPGGTP
ncbi:phage tail terminator protein [Nocardia sp. NPDC001965]